MRGFLGDFFLSPLEQGGDSCYGCLLGITGALPMPNSFVYPQQTPHAQILVPEASWSDIPGRDHFLRFR